jgi:hypothetical protein
MEVLQLCWIMLGFQAWVLEEGMACGLVAGRIWDSRVVLRGVSTHRGILSRHFMKDMLYMRAQLVDCS